jgi:serine/threonine protein kinase
MKLADFGFSKKDKAKRMTAQTMVGTPMYMSIQVLKGLPYSSKCDIWSLGLIFYEVLLFLIQMLFGRTAWTGNS